MRKWETWLLGGAWVAVAVLMPMAALEPIGGGAAADTPHLAFVAAACEDGSPRALIGCLSVSL